MAPGRALCRLVGAAELLRGQGCARARDGRALRRRRRRGLRGLPAPLRAQPDRGPAAPLVASVAEGWRACSVGAGVSQGRLDSPPPPRALPAPEPWYHVRARLLRRSVALPE